MPYRIDVRRPPESSLDQLVELGALDVESTPDGLAALMPDAVSPASVSIALGVDSVSVSPAVGRDDGSVWILGSRRVRVGNLLIVPANTPAPPGALTLADTAAFGTGLHATTALCLEGLDAIIEVDRPPALLDVGTGSGVLALAALLRGVPYAVALDVDRHALRAASRNARLNGLVQRLHLLQGGPEALRASWPLVVANILSAPLIEMAPDLARRVAHGGRLLLSGMSVSVTPDVERAYRRLGMTPVQLTSRGGWTSLLLQPSW